MRPARKHCRSTSVLPKAPITGSADAASRASTVRVFEYLPAPGLWVSGYMYGPLFTATTMAEACAYVQSRFDINYMISLGAWGGYVVTGFDHSVDNSGGGVDLAIRGNPYPTSRSRASSGSHRTRTATGNPTTRGTNWPVRSTTALKRSTTIRSPTISLRARRPPSSGATTAAEGARSTTTPTGTLRTATISRGCPEGECTFYGTSLLDRSYVDASGQTVVPPYDWGYADNAGKSDYDGQFCLFRLSNARTFDGRPADLKYIDFVKIQTGQMGKTALLGETSTEVHHIVDYHLIDRETE